jgi:major type 1 subunit fimbrin (pilin)
VTGRKTLEEECPGAHVECAPQPIDIGTNTNNDIANNAVAIFSGSAILNYFVQYIAPGKSESGSVTTSVEYTMQYQ